MSTATLAIAMLETTLVNVHNKSDNFDIQYVRLTTNFAYATTWLKRELSLQQAEYTYAEHKHAENAADEGSGYSYPCWQNPRKVRS